MKGPIFNKRILVTADQSYQIKKTLLQIQKHKTLKLNGKHIIAKVMSVLSLLLVGSYYNHLWSGSEIKRDWLFHIIEKSKYVGSGTVWSGI